MKAALGAAASVVRVVHGHREGKAGVARAGGDVPAARPKMPDHLSGEARKAWRQLIALLEERGTLSRADSMALSIWAETQARWIAAKAELAAHGITIEVTGGEKDMPVENASVYVKYVEEHKLRKDKKLELNVKTNRDGVAHVPNAPLGRVLIQVIAEGWKTYGRWYDITDTKQMFKIRLQRPPKWY